MSNWIFRSHLIEKDGGTIHELPDVEVPEWATDFELCCQNKKGDELYDAHHSPLGPIPQPQKKVMEWRWSFRVDGLLSETTGHLTEQKAQEVLDKVDHGYHKIPGTERVRQSANLDSNPWQSAKERQ